MFSHLSSTISEQPQGQKGPWLRVRAPPPRHLFLKSTRFSVTTVCCILCWENKHQHGGFADALWGSWLGLLRPNILHLVQNTRSEVKTDDNDECGKRGQS